MAKPLADAIDQRHDPVAFRHRERATGAEIVLHVHDQKQLVRHDSHPADRFPKVDTLWRKAPKGQRGRSGTPGAPDRSFPKDLHSAQIRPFCAKSQWGDW